MAVEKKKVFQIEIPLIGQSISALSTEQAGLSGRHIKLDMTRMLRGRAVEAVLETSIEGGKLTSKFLSLNLLPSYIRRMIRKNISWIEDSFVCNAQDVQLRVKPFMITKKRVHRSVRKQLRDGAKEFIVQFIADKSADNAFDAVLKGTLQKEMAAKLRRVYPLAFCEIRVLKIEKKKQ